MITSRQNASLKGIRRLRRCKGERAVLEGPHLVREALDSGIPLEQVLVTPDFLGTTEGRELRRRLPHPPVDVAPGALTSVTDADSPRGVVAVAILPRQGVEALPRRYGAVYLFLDGLQDPGNLGALARTAEATGVAGLALAPRTVHPNHPRALRASSGSLLRLPVARDATPEELDRHLASLSPVWVALDPRDGRDLYREPPQGTRILALGAEGPGLSEEVSRRATVRLTVPLEPPVESLNATVAAAVVLFEMRRRSREPDILPTTEDRP
jgi:TrmH family RNA methyltransferase